MLIDILLTIIERSLTQNPANLKRTNIRLSPRSIMQSQFLPISDGTQENQSTKW